MRALGILFFVVILLWLYAMSYAQAQSNHAQHHPSYRNWVNQQDRGCCDNKDCGELAEQDERITSSVTEVRIEGTWCPVKPHHYLKKGNAPDWSTSHVCVTQAYSGPSVCDRLLCYQPKPGT